MANSRPEMIPELPDSRAVTLDDKPVFDSIFQELGRDFKSGPNTIVSRPNSVVEISAYTFTNIFAWREAYGTTVSRLGSHLLVLNDHGDRISCLEPLGDGPVAPVTQEALRRVEKPLVFERLSGQTAGELAEAGWQIESDRDNWDYVYRTEDLAELAGRKYDAKRNFINRAKSTIDYEYVSLDGRTALECEQFASLWCEEKHCETVDGLRRERCAVYEMLANFEALGIKGGAIRVDGAIVAFSLGEALNPETFVIHVEKADARIEGLYQLINQEFCRAEARGLEFVNREQDLGIPGLRKAKESYHPATMIEVFRAYPPPLL